MCVAHTSSHNNNNNIIIVAIRNDNNSNNPREFRRIKYAWRVKKKGLFRWKTNTQVRDVFTCRSRSARPWRSQCQRLEPAAAVVAVSSLFLSSRASRRRRPHALSTDPTFFFGYFFFFFFSSKDRAYCHRRRRRILPRRVLRCTVRRRRVSLRSRTFATQVQLFSCNNLFGRFHSAAVVTHARFGRSLSLFAPTTLARESIYVYFYFRNRRRFW